MTFESKVKVKIPKNMFYSASLTLLFNIIFSTMIAYGHQYESKVEVTYT